MNYYAKNTVSRKEYMATTLNGRIKNQLSIVNILLSIHLLKEKIKYVLQEKIFTKRIELNINDKTITLNSTDDFEFFLDARTSISLDNFTRTLKASLSELKTESNEILFAEEKLAKIMSRSPETLSGITMRLRTIDSAIFSRDNGWRDIIIALNSNDTFKSCKYKQIALQKYLLYLSNRREMIESIQIELEKKNNLIDGKKEKFASTQIKTSELDLSNNSELTILRSNKGMTRMQKSKSIIIDIDEGEIIELFLSHYNCKLVAKDGIKFVDYNDVEYPLYLGINNLGRGQECSVILRDIMKEISRLHLVIINYNHNKLKLFDLSTHGTYLLPKYIMN